MKHRHKCNVGRGFRKSGVFRPYRRSAWGGLAPPSVRIATPRRGVANSRPVDQIRVRTPVFRPACRPLAVIKRRLTPEKLKSGNIKTKNRSLFHADSRSPRPVGDSASIDLACLCDMHPRLPADMAWVMVTRAALGLQRHKHSSGANLHVANESMELGCVLTWPVAELGTAKQHDHNRITEDGAEAIALAVAHTSRSWRIVRRLQREEHADWLLDYQDNGVRKLVAFEVSGIDQGGIGGRLSEKLAQVARSTDVDQRWAGVVGFQQPEAALRSVEVRKNGS